MSRYVSFIIQSQQGDGDGTMHWQVRSVHSQQPLCLPDASFLVRTWIDDNGQMVRGLIRHIQSGREIQFQSGERAEEFIRTWINGDSAPGIHHDLQRLGEDPPASMGSREDQGPSDG